MSTDTGDTRARTPSNAAALGIDAVLVVVFAAIGYWTHADTISLGGVASTAWPFLVALAVAHLLLVALDRPAAGLTGGAVAWLVTLTGGMVVRQLTGAGTATAFIVVAGVFNVVTLLGWRLIALLARRR
jgi:hypothetical protein